MVEIRGYGQDRYNRVMGLIVLEGRNINLEMIKAGLAENSRWKPVRGLDLGPLWDAEKKAREAHKGMWKLGHKYVSPLDWRKMHGGG
jgi:micrococcal nuclease